MQSSANSDMDFTDEIKAIEKKIDLTKRQVYSDLSPWQKVQLSRHPNRPYSPDLITRIFTNFEELHGDVCSRTIMHLLVVLPPLMDATRDGDCPAKGRKYRAKPPEEFWLSKPRRVPQSPSG